MCLAILLSTELPRTVDICQLLKAKSTGMLVSINLTERKNAQSKDRQQKNISKVQ
jgi:hypothetical protein